MSAVDLESADDASSGSAHSITSSVRSARASGIETYVPISRRQTAVELARIETYRLQHRTTVGSTAGPIPKEKWLPFGGEKDYPPQLPDPNIYVVEFTGENDPIHPHNWPTRKKLVICAVLAYVTFVSTFASAIFSSTLRAISAEFHISIEVATLGITLYVLGFAAGPTIWAPASEIFGRRWPVTIGIFGNCIFTISTAVAKDVQTIMLTRFFAGLFGAAPLAIVPAVFADMFDNAHRGIAIAAFAMTVFVGPFASPFTGGFITMSFLGWRWTMYITSFMGFFGVTLLIFLLKETYAPVVLVEKAKTLRRQTHNWGIHAKMDEVEVDVNELITKNFSRPFRMLFTEPIVFLLTLYMSFIYGILYALLAAYPVVFQGIYGMNLGVGGLPFIGLIIGEFLAGAYTILDQTLSYRKKLAANNDVPVPEWRLGPASIGGTVFTIGLFWFGWTGFKASIHWMAPTASGILVGFGIYTIFIQCFNYLVDSYITLAASVLAANTLLRSAVAAGFPLFARQMFVNLGVQWAGTLLGCLAAIMIPIPLGFMFFGPRLRKKSRFAPSPRVVVEKSPSHSA